MNADPRRPEKVQRYTPKTNGNGEDLTPDYMNLMGQHTTTANAAEQPKVESRPQEGGAGEDTPVTSNNVIPVTSNATNVIPTSPQYGVAIIPTSGTATVPNDLPTETITHPTETITDTTAKPADDGKELHSTPSRNDRFKVVKIASLEPFKRGRWKCMDYVDEAPPANLQNKLTTQSAGSSIQVAGGVYLQTQSLPQQQIQQMLGFANGTQFFPNVPAQMLPQAQYFYPQVANLQGQGVAQVPGSMPAQFVNSQQFVPAGVVPNAAGFNMPQSYPNVQYVPANLLQNQSGAFVPTSQNVQVQNFQQSQTYSGQPSISQSNIVQQQQQPLVNGHAFPQNEQGISLPTQTAKSVIINSNPSQPGVSQTQINQQSLQSQVNMQAQSQQMPVVQGQQFQQNPQFQQPMQQAQSLTQPQIVQPVQVVPAPQVVGVPSQNIDQGLTSNVYTNPQFTMSVNSLLDHDTSNEANESSGTTETVSESTDDPAKTNPVVNAIDNKIEQAMDLVKSHLMYTVREEVEVLKEKIAELMEKIQQLETENNYLRSQLFKDPSMAGGGSGGASQAVGAAPATQAPNSSVNTNAQTNATVPSTAPIQTKDVNVQQ